MTTNIPRYCPQRALPPYSYVPGVNAHPMSDPQGHSFDLPLETAAPLNEESYRTNETYLHAIDLFNYGYYWEAHEAWEGLWHAAGRKGATADFLKALIKLAAAGVKAREGRAAGVRQHAERAGELFGSVAGEWLFGLRVEELRHAAREVAAIAEKLARDGDADTDRQLPVVLRLGGWYSVLSTEY